MLHHSTVLWHKADISRKCSNRSVLSCVLSCSEILTPFECFSAFNAGDSIKQITFSFQWRYLFPPEATTVPQPWWESNESNDSERTVTSRDVTLLLENLLFWRCTGFSWNVTSASAAGQFHNKFTRDEGHTHDTEVCLCSPRREKASCFVVLDAL